jgi:hypothetical protein
MKYQKQYFKFEQQLVAEHGDKVALWVSYGGECVAYGWKHDSNGQPRPFGQMAELIHMPPRVPKHPRVLRDHPGMLRVSVQPEDFDAMRATLVQAGWVVHCVDAARLLEMKFN